MQAVAPTPALTTSNSDGCSTYFFRMKKPMRVIEIATSASTRLSAASGLLLLASGAVWADDAALLRCRELAVPAERFTCYEAIVVKGRTPAPVQPPTRPASDDAQFGLENKAMQLASPSIESSIPGRFRGWSAGDTIVLANGQRWQINDDSQGVVAVSDPKVKIRRGALGAFYMEIAGSNRSPKVRRLP